MDAPTAAAYGAPAGPGTTGVATVAGSGRVERRSCRGSSKLRPTGSVRATAGSKNLSSVLPIRITSPSLSRMISVARTPFTQVPFVDPRSTSEALTGPPDLDVSAAQVWIVHHDVDSRIAADHLRSVRQPEALPPHRPGGHRQQRHQLRMFLHGRVSPSTRATVPVSVSPPVSTFTIQPDAYR
ncbi:hypothetical protein GCM10029963_60460 [Micromonospora andamanensis]